MDTFDYIRCICEKTPIPRDLSDFNAFMTRRWLSMMSPEMCYLVDILFNDNHGLEDSDLFHLMYAGVPQMRFKFPKYIKPDNKPHGSDEKEDLSRIARSMELSEREIQSYRDMGEEFTEFTSKLQKKI